jgi:hypothetical protein
MTPLALALLAMLVIQATLAAFTWALWPLIRF